MGRVGVVGGYKGYRSPNSTRRYEMARCIGVFVVLVLLASTVEAQMHSHFLPEGTQARVDGEEMRCFTLEQGKELYQLDADLFFARQKIVLLGQKLRIGEELKDVYVQKVSLFQKDRDIRQFEYERLYKKWIPTNRRMHELEQRGAPDWTSAHWLVLGGEVAILVLGVALLAR